MAKLEKSIDDLEGKIPPSNPNVCPEDQTVFLKDKVSKRPQIWLFISANWGLFKQTITVWSQRQRLGSFSSFFPQDKLGLSCSVKNVYRCYVPRLNTLVLKCHSITFMLISSQQQKCTQLPLLEGSQTIAIPLLVTHPQNITNILYCRIYLFAEDFGSISAPRLYIAIVKTRAAVKTSTFRKHGLLMHTG